MSVGTVLAFENFVLLMAVIFGCRSSIAASVPSYSCTSPNLDTPGATLSCSDRVRSDTERLIQSTPSVDEPYLLLDLVLVLSLAPRAFRLVLVCPAGLPG